ncbi:MAG: class II glutamine amidotransferase [Hyphomonadaceae bacterium]|jgi:glutamine amidotransferase|nr:class II glutamine amidotransferase [Hyphomonadaceae bacterium]
MCRWVAYLGEPIFLEEFVTTPQQSLIVQSRHSREAKSAVNGDGFGLGWYRDRQEPGLFRDVRPAWSDENLLSLAHQIRSRLFFAHVRASTGTATTRANCHPFRHGHWMFMHNGKIGGWDRLRRCIEAAIPDPLFQCRQGTTDSEVIFLLLLANGLQTDPRAACTATLRFIEGIMRDADEAEPLRVTAAISDGQQIYALRYASDAVPETLYVRSRQRGSGTLVVSEPLDDGRDDWEAVRPQSFVTLGPGGVSIEPLRISDGA